MVEAQVETQAKSSAAPVPTATAKGSGSDDSKLFGALSYFLGVITGVLFYFIKKDDAYIRFHAVQSIIFNVILIAVYVVLGIVAVALAFIPFLGWFAALGIYLLLGLVVFVLWLFLMYKAYKGEKYMLPVIGKYAEKYAK